MRLQVTYQVPVEVVVNTETGEVECVIVVDEEVKIDRDDCEPDGLPVHTTGYDRVEDRVECKRAVADAERAIWPAWEFGF